MKNIKGLTKRETLAIAEYEKLLLQKLPNRIQRLILFGSKARETSTPSSDVDILVVVSKNGKNTVKEIAILTHQPIAKYMVDISPIMVEESFFKEWSPLLEHITKDGVVLWTRKKAGKNI